MNAPDDTLSEATAEMPGALTGQRIVDAVFTRLEAQGCRSCMPPAQHEGLMIDGKARCRDA